MRGVPARPKTKEQDGENLRSCRLRAVAAIVVVTFMTATITTVAAAQPPPRTQTKPAAEPMKGCFITDKNGRRWPCSRALPRQGANLTTFTCEIENRMGGEESMFFYCDDDDIITFYVGPGETTVDRTYDSVFDPAPKHRHSGRRTGPRVACEWRYAGNTMARVVVWDEQWPEAWSCRDREGGGGGGQCRLVFENREVAIVAGDGGGRRWVLGDLAMKECNKNWWGFGQWLPWGLGCTYPKHDHPYVGTIES